MRHRKGHDDGDADDAVVRRLARVRVDDVRVQSAFIHIKADVVAAGGDGAVRDVRQIQRVCSLGHVLAVARVFDGDGIAPPRAVRRLFLPQQHVVRHDAEDGVDLPPRVGFLQDLQGGVAHIALGDAAEVEHGAAFRLGQRARGRVRRKQRKVAHRQRRLYFLFGRGRARVVVVPRVRGRKSPQFCQGEQRRRKAAFGERRIRGRKRKRLQRIRAYIDRLARRGMVERKQVAALDIGAEGLFQRRHARVHLARQGVKVVGGKLPAVDAHVLPPHGEFHIEHPAGRCGCTARKQQRRRQ